MKRYSVSSRSSFARYGLRAHTIGQMNIYRGGERR